MHYQSQKQASTYANKQKFLSKKKNAVKIVLPSNQKKLERFKNGGYEKFIASKKMGSKNSAQKFYGLGGGFQ